MFVNGLGLGLALGLGFAPPQVYLLRGYAGSVAAKASAAQNDWVALVSGPGSLVAKAANAGAEMYNKWMRPLWNHAEQRHVASCYDLSQITLAAVPFADMINNTSTALPIGPNLDDAAAESPWKWNPPQQALQQPAGAVDDFDAAPIANLATTLRQRLSMQWTEFVAFCRPVALRVPHGAAVDMRAFGDSDRFQYETDTDKPLTDADGVKIPKLPAWYWIRTRRFWPDLSELMLFCQWLCAPVITAGLERGFSFQTLIDHDTRRRRSTYDHMRDDVMVHIHRKWFSSSLDAC